MTVGIFACLLFGMNLAAAPVVGACGNSDITLPTNRPEGEAAIGNGQSEETSTYIKPSETPGAVILEETASDKKRKTKKVPEIYTPYPDLPVPKALKSEVLAAQLRPGMVAPIVRNTQQGIDVSHYQGYIDWDEVASDKNISYVYIKASEGALLQDDRYAYNVREARRAGLLVGAYHFFRANVDLNQQLRNMTSMIRPEDVDLVPIIDVEHTGGSSSAALRRKLERFLEMVEEYYGKRPMLYTFLNFYNKHFVGSSLDRYPLMIAYYQDDAPELHDDGVYAIWQYTSHGSVDGIRGNVDRSRLMNGFTVADLAL